MSSQLGSRLVYQNAKAMVERAGFSTNQAVLSQSYIRTEIAASTTLANYRFPILINDNFAPTYPTMNLLNLQDAFIVGKVFIGLTVATATATNFKLYTYPNKTAFPTGTLSTLYNGKMTITVNNRQIVPAWEVKKHYYVPTTQEGVGGGGTGFVLPSFDEQHENSGAVSCEPNIVLVGSKSNDVSIQLPAAFGTLDANTRIVLIFSGVLAQNVTPVR